MVKIRESLLVLLLLGIIVNAVNLEIIVRNAYTFEPLDSALVNVFNSSGEDVGYNLSDSDGIVDFGSLFTSTAYDIKAYKPGYNEEWLYDLYFENATQRILYLTQFNEGIIKLNYADLSLRDHGICLYMSNGRLLDCYTPNDTIVITEDNYDLYVKEGVLDYATNQGQFVNVIMQYIPFIFIVMVLIAIILVGIMLIWRLMR